MPPDTRLIPVPIERKPELDHLLQTYLDETAAYAGETSGDDGRYDYPYFDLYWQEDTRHPFFIDHQGRVAGFVLVRRLTEESDRVVYSIAEFYVRPGFRRRGIGREAARLAFQSFPGVWRVAQLGENQPAQSFWREVIAKLTDGNYREIANPDWDGPLQEFTTG